MGKLVVSENITLDGVVQDPTGEEGSRHGGWFAEISDIDRQAWAELELEEATAAEALLFGRRTYEFFAARWPSRTGAWADRLNIMPKYVASSTLIDPRWHNTTVLGENVADEIARTKQRLEGDLVVYASRTLVRALLHHGLVDEVRLVVHPFVLGSGDRLFDEGPDRLSFRRAEVRALGDSLVLLRHEVVRRG